VAETTGRYDDTGALVPVPSAVERVVSLVPSLTESLAATAPELLVGATDWCTHPAGLDVVRVRGTKNPRVDQVIELEPDLVLANAEENREADIAALRAAGVPVWVTYPRTVPEAVTSLERMLAACGLSRPAWLAEAQEVWEPPFTGARRTALVPIWRRPWMAVGSGTFTGDVLARLGIDNVLAEHPERYPKVELDRLPAYQVVVLPDEPYAFSPTDGPECFDVPSYCVSGRYLTWNGPSLVEARAALTAALA
jgi:ABC-type Fe3+-hydroxamate transport system substrate-binding protein